ncbi:hypothetical protein OPT61_g5976 [Boeremia exigua]|uniref:Uncharacterized protein n=1 Tax=Boeremia exigua TaxID=749465 RepID=A0ACC2I8A0_9PLEO|nr:hypothetical protein OPT61_g5976 [Boeremia exigua]
MAQHSANKSGPRAGIVSPDPTNYNPRTRLHQGQGPATLTGQMAALDTLPSQLGSSHVPEDDNSVDAPADIETPSIDRRTNLQAPTALQFDIAPSRASHTGQRASDIARSSTASFSSVLSARRWTLNSSGAHPGESSTTLPTFRTARESFRSWVTASSFQRVPLLQRQIVANTEFFKEHGPKDDRSDEFEALVNRTLRDIAACGSQNLHFPVSLVRAALRQQLLPLLNGNLTSLASLLKGLMSSMQSFLNVQNAGQLEMKISAHIYRFAHELSLGKNNDVVASELNAIYGAFSKEWLTRLKEKGLILAPEEELDWSGRGQHVVFNIYEKPHIPLQHLRELGYGASGVVDQVRCRRINLARKKIRCTKELTREEAAAEVAHLQRLQHRHIVRLVGTYMVQKDLYILMYPAAALNLARFLDVALNAKIGPQPIASENQTDWVALFLGVLACLTKVVAFLHDHNVKHMDIKPANILINHYGTQSAAKVYIADFGISRSYRSLEESYTRSGIPFTPTYAAPEVAKQETKGPPADIFSLGCVFLEVLATMLSTRLDDQQTALQETRDTTDGDPSYENNKPAVLAWYTRKQDLISYHVHHLHQEKSPDIDSWPQTFQWTAAIPLMLATEPEDRPTAAQLDELTSWACCGCCDKGPEPFEAADAHMTCVAASANA